MTVIMPAVIAIIALQIAERTAAGRYIDQKISHPGLFRFKEWWEPSTLDPRIKILSFDNRAAAYLKSHDLTLPDWAKTIRAIAAKGDIKIIVPKIFDSPYEQNEISEAVRILETVNQTSTAANIVFTSPQKIDIRPTVSQDRLDKNLRSVVSSAVSNDILEGTKVNHFVYGAGDQVLAGFSAFGHVDYAGDNRIRPIIALEIGALIPQLALTAIRNVEINPSDIKVMGKSLRLSPDGSILINTIPDPVIRKRALGLLPAVIQARQDKDITPIRPGDYVVLIPAMFTGAASYVETAHGTMPGSFLTVSILNSALKGSWISEHRDPGFIILLTGLLGFFLGFFIKPGKSAVYLIVASLAVTFFAMIMFAGFLRVFPFILPVFSLFIGGLSGLISQVNVSGIEDLRLQKELEIATIVQKSFFPPVRIETESPLRVSGRFAAASECGGDWWGQMRLGGYTYLMIGDAVGHGIPAALVTAVAFSATKIFEERHSLKPEEPIDPSKILEALNNVLCAMHSERACMTFLVMRIHDDSGQCVVANAGNPQPLIIPADAADIRLTAGQRTKVITARGDVLGLVRDSVYYTSSLSLSPGDRVLFYTDGLVENRAQATKNPLGKNWLKSILPKSSIPPDADLGEHIWSQYKHSIGSTPPDDDTTVVLLAYKC